MLTFVRVAMVSSEIPRRSRSRRIRGPKVSRSDMADASVSQIPRRAAIADLLGSCRWSAVAANVPVIGVTMLEQSHGEVSQLPCVVPLPADRRLLQRQLEDSVRSRRARRRGGPADHI